MDQTKELLAKFEEALANADLSEALEALRVEYCGKKGHVAGLMGMLKSVPNEEKKAFGQAVNEVKQEIEKKLAEAQAEIVKKEEQKLIDSAEDYDVSLPMDMEMGS